MATKILEKNGVDNTNIDGARFNRFCAGNRDGIIQGAFDEAQVSVLNSNTLQIGAGEFLISGFRVVIDATEFAFSTLPLVATRYHLVAQIQLDAEMQPTFTLFVRPISNLTQNDLFDESVNNSIYQLEVARFTLAQNGISDILRVADRIVGGTNEGANINIGNVVTEKIDMDLDAEVDVESRYDEEQAKHFFDFTFHLPIDVSKIVGTANSASTNASNAVTTANNALAVVEEQSVGVNNAINRANTISADLEQKVASDYYRGEKGDKGDKGDVGATFTYDEATKTLTINTGE